MCLNKELPLFKVNWCLHAITICTDLNINQSIVTSFRILHEKNAKKNTSHKPREPQSLI